MTLRLTQRRFCLFAHRFTQASFSTIALTAIFVMLSRVIEVQGADSPATFRFTKIEPLPGGGVEFRSTGPVSMTHSLEVSRDLKRWRIIDFQHTTTGSSIFQDLNGAGLTERFYRLRAQSASVSVISTNYHKWPDSIILNNGVAEVIVVPTVGRIMEFRFAGESNGPFWENEKLAGLSPSSNSWNTPGSFGGDKVWPAPQSDWNWPPPRAFDSLAYTSAFTNGQAMLTGPVDPTTGIRVVRQIQLHPVEPLLRVTSRFEKRQGQASRVSVWVVTQLEDPVRLFLPIPARSGFSTGYFALGPVPKSLAVTNGLISLTRDATESTKIGNDAGTLLWIGERNALRIESPRNPSLGSDAYPDNGCSAEIYTNPDPARYIEMEFLGPLTTLNEGDSTSATSTYQLYRRTRFSPYEEAALIRGSD